MERDWQILTKVSKEPSSFTFSFKQSLRVTLFELLELEDGDNKILRSFDHHPPTDKD